MRWLAALLVLPGLAWAAAAPDISPRPKPRPSAVMEAHNPTAAPVRAPRPRLRPATQAGTGDAVRKVVVEDTINQDIAARRPVSAPPRFGTATAAGDTALRGSSRDAALGDAARPDLPFVIAGILSSSPFAVARSLRPPARPRDLRIAMIDTRPSATAKPVVYGKTGSVCGINGLRGYSVKPVAGRGGCGIKQPVRLTEVDGVKLTREALVGCDVARALYGWVNNKAKPTIGGTGGGLSRIQMIAGYSCRTRNSRSGAKLSEHAKGRAVDIAGFTLKNGTTMSVLRDFRNGPHAPLMRKLHSSACGPFRTVLGPNADSFHQDHFHFDVASYRGGTYCR